MEVTRRVFVRDGTAAVVGAAGALSLGLPGLRGLERALGSDPIRKCISLPDNWFAGANDYRGWGNRQYVADSNTRWVKLWVGWNYFQGELQTAPPSRASSWNHLNSAPGGRKMLRQLDAQIQAINKDSSSLAAQGKGRIGVILCLYHEFPAWSSAGTAAQKSADPARYGKPITGKLPDNRGTNGPWAWFVSHLMARYRSGVAINPRGPHDPDGSDTGGYDPRFGNPYGAWLDRIEVMNEPNLLYWPQSVVQQASAEMIRTAATLASRWGFSGSKHGLLVPATSDYPDPTDGVSPGKATNWRTYTEGVLKILRSWSWKPSVYVGWSHHNYKDVKYGGYGGASSRAILTRDLLRSYNWRLGGDRFVYLTEGGYDCAEDLGDNLISEKELNRQRDLIRTNFELMRTTPDIPMWTQHSMHDMKYGGNDFKSALRGDFDWSKGPGPPKPAWYLWRNELAGAGNI